MSEIRPQYLTCGDTRCRNQSRLEKKEADNTIIFLSEPARCPGSPIPNGSSATTAISGGPTYGANRGVGTALCGIGPPCSPMLASTATQPTGPCEYVISRRRQSTRPCARGQPTHADRHWGEPTWGPYSQLDSNPQDGMAGYRRPFRPLLPLEARAGT